MLYLIWLNFCRHKGNRDLRDVDHLTKFLKCLRAIHTGHHDIQQNKIRGKTSNLI